MAGNKTVFVISACKLSWIRRGEGGRRKNLWREEKEGEKEKKEGRTRGSALHACHHCITHSLVPATHSGRNCRQEEAPFSLLPLLCPCLPSMPGDLKTLPHFSNRRHWAERRKEHTPTISGWWWWWWWRHGMHMPWLAFFSQGENLLPSVCVVCDWEGREGRRGN